MKYFVLDRDGNIICHKGGYNTKRGALEGRRSLTSPVFNEGIKFARNKGLPPGSSFASEVRAYIEENSEIVEVSEIIYKTTDGRSIISH